MGCWENPTRAQSHPNPNPNLAGFPRSFVSFLVFLCVVYVCVANSRRKKQQEESSYIVSSGDREVRNERGFQIWAASRSVTSSVECERIMDDGNRMTARDLFVSSRDANGSVPDHSAQKQTGSTKVQPVLAADNEMETLGSDAEETRLADSVEFESNGLKVPDDHPVSQDEALHFLKVRCKSAVPTQIELPCTFSHVKAFTIYYACNQS